MLRCLCDALGIECYRHLLFPCEILAIVSTLEQYCCTPIGTLVKVCDHNTGPSNPKRPRLTDDCESRQPETTKPPKFTTLLRELSSEVSADWEDIGIGLELKQGDLSAIKSDHQECKKCFREMLKLWLKQVDPPPTWSAIIEAIEVFEYESLAEELRKKYCN